LAKKRPAQSIQSFDEFLLKRDYIGVKTLLKLSKDFDDEDELAKTHWFAFCDFHLGEYRSALTKYEKIQAENPSNEIALNIGVCKFYLGM
jgi:intraflagellar transport protein 56